jgi:hypothetical protein
VFLINALQSQAHHENVLLAFVAIEWTTYLKQKVQRLDVKPTTRWQDMDGKEQPGRLMFCLLLKKSRHTTEVFFLMELNSDSKIPIKAYI